MTFPTPSMILYVGNCFPSAVTALKKWGLGVMGDWEVGNRPCPWLSGKETGVVVDRHLRNMREKVKCVQVRKVRIIWKVNSELASINLFRLAHTTDRRVANAGPGGKKRLARVDRTGVIVMVTLSHLIEVNFKFMFFFVLRSVSAVVFSASASQRARMGLSRLFAHTAPACDGVSHPGDET